MSDHKLVFRTRIVDVTEILTNAPATPTEKLVILEWGCTKCGEQQHVRVGAHHAHTVIRALQAAILTDPEAFTELVPDAPSSADVVMGPFPTKVQVN